MQDDYALDPAQVVQLKWSYRDLGPADLRKLWDARGRLTAEEAAALSEVMAERGIAPTVHQAPYRGPHGFVMRHLKGDYSLGRSYWVHTFLLSLVASAAITALMRASAGLPARYVSLGALLALVAAILVWLWGVVGTWASSNKHVGRGGSGFWAAAVRVALVFGILRNIGELVAFGPGMAEHFRVATGEQPGAHVELVVRADGRSLLLRGGINDDAAADLERALRAAPGVTTVVLESGGGWIREGERLARVISDRRLATYVETECTSACTIAFLAGHDRAAAPSARLGFHTFRGVGARGGQSLEDVSEVYGRSGMAPAFIQRIRDTPHQDVWYPPHDELLRERVLTRSSAGGETAALATTTRSRDQLVQELKMSPVFAAAARRHATRFDRIADRTWEALQAHRTDREVLQVAHRELFALTRELMPAADDATMLAFLTLRADQADVLRQASPEACVDVVFHGSGQSFDLGALLPRSFAGREQQLLQAIVETSDPRHAHRGSPAETAEVLRKVVSRVPAAHARVLAAGSSGNFPALRRCDAGIALLDALIALPPAQRALYTRQLFGS